MYDHPFITISQETRNLHTRHIHTDLPSSPLSITVSLVLYIGPQCLYVYIYIYVYMYICTSVSTCIHVYLYRYLHELCIFISHRHRISICNVRTQTYKQYGGSMQT
eukprot:GHVQ01034409.1.p1 GENE.GHVQ01034409.1~~GHVQ01034409.1.p1  ORF type:complete len:106 (-),score=1.65 GHVQ01034409.1:509-826(-)